MALKSLHLLFIFISSTMVAHLYEVDAKQAPVVDGYTPTDPKDSNIVEMGKFAITEHNNETYEDLEFISIVKAEKQVVDAGTYCRMTISAKDNKIDKVKTYMAVVWSKPSDHIFQLTSFDDEVQGVKPDGGWKRIDNVNDPKVVKVANIAVAQHNKETGYTNLMYVGIIRGEKQSVDAGINYKLVIITKDYNTGKTKNYLALVYVESWETIKLRSFEAVLG